MLWRAEEDAANIGFELNADHRFAFRNFYSHDNSDETRFFEGYNGDKDTEVRDYRLRFVEESLFSSQVTGQHNFKIFGNSLLEWQIGRGLSKLEEPDLRESLYEYRSSLDAFVLADESQSGFRMFNDLSEDLWEPKLDWSTFTNTGMDLSAAKTKLNATSLGDLTASVDLAVDGGVALDVLDGILVAQGDFEIAL